MTEPSPYCKLYGVLIEAIVWDRVHQEEDKQKVIGTLKWMRDEFRKEAEKYAG